MRTSASISAPNFENTESDIGNFSQTLIMYMKIKTYWILKKNLKFWWHECTNIYFQKPSCMYFAAEDDCLDIE